ncbi:MAG: glycosyltransferase [Cyanobacteria bacterium P01_H01_bin.21]
MSSISYVVPTLNSEKTLDQTLLSLNSQVGIDVDVTVVDSGSTDGTLDICERWGIKVIYAKPGNMYYAINVGLSESDSEWVAYINSDDYLYADSILRLINNGDRNCSDVVYGNCDYVDCYGRFMYAFNPPNPRWLKSICRTGGMGFAQQTSIFRNSLYKKLNGFDENYRFVADRDFYVRALMSGASFSYLRGPSLACFRLHNNQFSQQSHDLMSEEGQKIMSSLVNECSILDSGVRFIWRMSNFQNYALRIIRQSLLADRWQINKSMHSGIHIADRV